jgi:protein SCO1
MPIRATILRVAALTFSSIVGIVLWFAIARPIQVLPRMQLVAPFTLTDQSQHWVSEADLLGHITLVSFGYTSCGVQCTSAESALLRMRQQFASDSTLTDRLQVFTISLDPQHDSPAMLQEYTQQFDIGSASWHVLTGPSAEIKQLVGGNMGIYYTRQPNGQLMFDQHILLIDQTGRIRARYSVATADVAMIQRDLQLLIREAHESVGSQRVLYEAAHLFVCYPQ